MPRKFSRESFLVIGLGNFGRSLAINLTRLGHEVIGVDSNMSLLEQWKDEIDHVEQLDATNPQALKEFDQRHPIRHFSVCVVGRGTDLADSITITMSLLEFGARRVMAKAVTDQQAQILEKIGAHEIVFPERDMGERIAHILGTPRTLDYIELGPNVSIEEITPPPSIVGRSLRELHLRRDYGLNVLAVRRNGQIDSRPRPDDVIEAGDCLFVMGREEDVARFLRMDK